MILNSIYGILFKMMMQYTFLFLRFLFIFCLLIGRICLSSSFFFCTSRCVTLRFGFFFVHMTIFSLIIVWYVVYMFDSFLFFLIFLININIQQVFFFFKRKKSENDTLILIGFFSVCSNKEYIVRI